MVNVLGAQSTPLSDPLIDGFAAQQDEMPYGHRR